MSRFGLAVRRQAGKRKDFGSIPLRLSFLFKKVVVCGHCLVSLSIASYWNIQMALIAAILMQKSFLWWQCSDRYIISISLSPHLHTPSPPPFSPSLISLVSVDAKQYFSHSRQRIWRKKKWGWMDRKSRKIWQGRNSCWWAKQTWPYSNLLQALKGEHLSALGSQQRVP